MVVDGRAGADRPDHLGEVVGAAIGQIIAVDRGDDDVREAEVGDRVGDVLRLVGIERRRQAGRDIAEGAGARADLAHDHHGGVLLGPAFTDIGAAGLLADGDQIVLAHDLLGFAIDRRAGRPHADPVRLAQHFAVRPMRLFRMPGACLDQGNQENS